jgi:hypothetical protein
MASEAPTSVLRLTLSLEHERAARGDFPGDIDRLAVVLPCRPQIGHDLVNQASCLGVVHPECGLELIGEGRRKSFADPGIAGSRLHTVRTAARRLVEDGMNIRVGVRAKSARPLDCAVE